MRVFHSNLTRFHLPAPVSLLSFRVVNGVLSLRDSTFDKYKQTHGYGDGQEMFRLDNDYYRYWETVASSASQGGAMGSITRSKNCFGYAPHHLIDDLAINLPDLTVKHGETTLVLNSFGFEFHSLGSVLFAACAVGYQKTSNPTGDFVNCTYKVPDRLS